MRRERIFVEAAVGLDGSAVVNVSCVHRFPGAAPPAKHEKKLHKSEGRAHGGYCQGGHTILGGGFLETSRRSGSRYLAARRRVSGTSEGRGAGTDGRASQRWSEGGDCTAAVSRYIEVCGKWHRLRGTSMGWACESLDCSGAASARQMGQTGQMGRWGSERGRR